MLYKVLVPTVGSPRSFVPYNDTFYADRIKPLQTSMYESIFIYEDRHKDILTKTKSLSGITDVVTDKVVFDFDSKDGEVALEDARTLVARLMTVFGDNKNVIRCFFSGSKGYHIEVHFDKEYITRKEFEAIITKFAGDLTTFDPRVKDEQRLFRFPLSKHEKTKAFKIPIIVDHFTDLGVGHADCLIEATKLNMEFINAALASYTTVKIPEQFKNIKPLIDAVVAEPIVDEMPNMEYKPKHLTAAKYVLSLGFFDEGERNEACNILAATFRFLNFTKDQAYELVKLAVNSRNARLGLGKLDRAGKNEIYTKNIDFIYGPSWTGATYSDSSNTLLIKTINKYKLESYYSIINSDVVTISEMADKFCKFADEIDSCIIKIGVPEIDDNLLLTSSMMVGILGAPSSGKTAFALNTLEHQSVNNINSFFVSADMSNHLLFASLMRRHCKMDFKVLLDATKNTKYASWSKEHRDAWDLVIANLKNVGYSFNSGPSVVDIKNKLEDHEQKTGSAVKFLVVDYLEKLTCNYTDPTAASGYNASRLSDLTRDRDLTTFLLLQTQKASGDPSSELLSMRNIKGASVIEQDSRVVITTWRVGFNPDVKGKNHDDKYASFAVVKNNMGTTGRYDLHVDSGMYRSLNDEELVDFQRVKQDSINRRIAKANGGQMPQQRGNGPMPQGGTSGPVRFIPKNKGELY